MAKIFQKENGPNDENLKTVKYLAENKTICPNNDNFVQDLLERELEAVGIRLNTKKPDIYFKEKKGGGLAFNATCNLTHVDEKMVSRGHWI